MTIKGKTFLLVSAVSTGIGMLISFSALAAQVTVQKAPDFEPGRVRRVAFLPLAAVLPAEGAARAICPKAGDSFRPCRIEDAAEAELSRVIGGSLLSSGASVSFVPQAEINAALARLKKEGHPELTTQGSWQMALAHELSADAVLFGFVYCYRNRSGSALASTQPAALGFCLHLADPQTGKVLWSFRYEDEQQALTEDLLSLPAFLHRRGRWITAPEMAEEAASVLIKNFPWPARPRRKEQ